MPRYFYAAHNSRANLREGNQGFLNTWQISRFKSKGERDAFVKEYENQRAYALTRREADQLFRSQYECVGREPPAGGLFASNRAPYELFSNEQ